LIDYVDCDCDVGGCCGIVVWGLNLSSTAAAAGVVAVDKDDCYYYNCYDDGYDNYDADCGGALLTMMLLLCYCYCCCQHMDYYYYFYSRYHYDSAY